MHIKNKENKMLQIINSCVFYMVLFLSILLFVLYNLSRDMWHPKFINSDKKTNEDE